MKEFMERHSRIYISEGHTALTLLLDEFLIRRLLEDAGEDTEAMLEVSFSVPGLCEAQGQKHVFEPDSELPAIKLEYVCQEEIRYWDEFAPELYVAQIGLKVLSGGKVLAEEECRKKFGICEFRTIGTQFFVNGNTVFLRALEVGQRPDVEYTDFLRDLKDRGLNCVSVKGEFLEDELLEAADLCGIYVKVQAVEDEKEQKELVDRYGEHPSFVLLHGYAGSGEEARRDGLRSCEWVEFAVRDRLDYSDAPDTKSDHLEDISSRDCPTLVTSVGEWRKRPLHASPEMRYLASICCREAMEEAIRTPGFGGYCLHEDALVFELSVRRMREFSAAVVPLLLFKKYVWSTDEVIKAEIMVANYGNKRILGRISVSAVDERGSRYVVTSNKTRMTGGGVANIGEIQIPLSQFTPSQRIELQISVDGTEYKNHYAIWLFSDDIPVKIPPHVHVARKIDGRVRELLKEGKKVVFIPKLNTVKQGLPGWFSPLASQLSSEREKVAAGGICCKPQHPALRGFPTEEIGDYQWWNLIHNSIPVALERDLADSSIVSMPSAEEDEFPMQLIFEAKVENGTMLFCAIDLLIQLDRAEARQLFRSLLQYVASNRFHPEMEMNMEELEEIFMS